MKKISLILLFSFLFFTIIAEAGYSFETSAPTDETPFEASPEGSESFWDLPAYLQIIAASAIILGLGWKLIAILTGWVRKDPNNENRMKILRFIEQNPGSTVNMIEQDLGIKRGTVRYHVNTLKDNGKILMFRNGNYVSLFKNESAIWNKSQSRTIEPHLQGVTCKNVCRLIYENPGITNKEISEILGLSKSAVASHIRTLEDMGCLIIQASGKFKNYYLTEEHHPDALPFFEKVS